VRLTNWKNYNRAAIQAIHPQLSETKAQARIIRAKNETANGSLAP
jgi:hypothetical protein